MPNEWDRTPWMMGGGAKHSVNVGRLLSYAAFGGGEGVIGSKDLEVRSAAVPNGTVRVFPGACAILNRGLNISYEAYAARLPITDTIAISPTGSGGGRSDLVVAVIMNPYQDGEPWPDPPQADVDAGTAEFVKTMVIPNVAAGTKDVVSLGLGYSAIALARIDIPANTGTITQAMIVDLRSLAQVRQWTFTKAQHAVAPIVLDGTYRTFPVEAVTNLEVPAWATHVTTQASVVNFLRTAGNATVEFILRMTSSTGAGQVETYTFVDLASTDLDRMTAFVGPQRHAIPSAWRGKVAYLEMYARETGSATASIDNAVTAFSMEARFEQSRESNA